MFAVNVSEEAIQAMKKLEKDLLDLMTALQGQYDELLSVFHDNHKRLGAHSADIGHLIDEIQSLMKENSTNIRKIRLKISRAANIRTEHIEKQSYHPVSPFAENNDQNSTEAGGYISPYKPTTVSIPISYTNPQTKCHVEKVTERIVHQYSGLDAVLVIPAGTQYPNGKCVQHDTTNLELMEQGKAPFVKITNADGSEQLVQLELHHLIGEETLTSGPYFLGEEKDGTLVEIPSTVHKKYKYPLHLGTPSFRRDGEGNKTEEAVKYEKYRVEYWKYRARKFRQGMNLPYD